MNGRLLVYTNGNRGLSHVLPAPLLAGVAPFAEGARNILGPVEPGSFFLDLLSGKPLDIAIIELPIRIGAPGQR
jgi:hypothetical protein